MGTRVYTPVGVSAALEQDAILMLRVKEGDGQSFELLLEKYRSPLVNYLNRMIQNQPIAEELSQEVFLRVYRARGTYEPTAKFTTWLYRIATHLALNSLRGRRHERAHRSIADVPEDRQPIELVDRRFNREQEMLADSRLQIVRNAIADLPDPSPGKLLDRFQVARDSLDGSLGKRSSPKGFVEVPDNDLDGIHQREVEVWPELTERSDQPFAAAKRPGRSASSHGMGWTRCASSQLKKKNANDEAALA